MFQTKRNRDTERMIVCTCVRGGRRNRDPAEREEIRELSQSF